MSIAETVYACGMCVVTAYGVLVVAGQYVRYRNAKRRAEEASRAQDSEQSPPVESPAPAAQPA